MSSQRQLSFWSQPKSVEKTLADWNAAGRRISKGAKMCGRNERGVPVFAEIATYYPSPRRHRGGSGIFKGGSTDHGSGDWDEDPGFSDLGIGDSQ